MKKKLYMFAAAALIILLSATAFKAAKPVRADGFTFYAETTLDDGGGNKILADSTDTFEVAFKMRSSPGITSFEAFLTHSEVFVFDSVIANSVIFNNSTATRLSGTRMKLIADDVKTSDQTTPDENFTLVTVVFKLNQGISMAARFGTHDFTFSDICVYDRDIEEITPAHENFSITVQSAGGEIPVFTFYAETSLEVDGVNKIMADSTDTFEIAFKMRSSPGITSFEGFLTHNELFVYDSVIANTVIFNNSTATRLSATRMKLIADDVKTSDQTTVDDTFTLVTVVFKLNDSIPVADRAGNYPFTYQDLCIYDRDIEEITAAEETFSVTVDALSSDKSITAVKVDGAAPVQSGNTYTAAAVAYTKTTATVNVTVPATATLTIGGTAAQSGVNRTVNLTAGGDTTVPVVVTAQDGSTADYSIIIPRATVSAASDLTSLVLSGTVEESFTSITGTTINATKSLKYADTSVTIKAAVSPLATLKIAGKAATPGTAVNVSLAEKNLTESIIIEVTAENGTTVTSYTLNILRTPAATGNDILTLKIGSAALTASGTAYTYEVPYATASTNLSATFSALSTATIQKAGGSVDTLTTAAKALNFDVGENNYTIKVTSEAGAVKSYTLKVTRDAGDNADLKSLTLEYADGTAIDFTPGFSADRFVYDANVREGTTQIKINAEPDSGKARIEGTGLRTLSGSPVSLTVKVTAENGTEKTYTVTVKVSADRSISSLSVNGNSLTASGGVYTAAPVAFGLKSAAVVVTIPNTNAVLTIGGVTVNSGATHSAALVSGGTTEVTIRVTAYGEYEEYKLYIPMTAASTDNSIKELYVNGTRVTPVGDTFTGEQVAYTAADASLRIELPEFATLKVNSVDRQGGTAFDLGLTAGGDTQVTIVVTAQSGASKTYTLIIPRVPLGSLSGENRLESLSLSMTDGTPVAFDTAFSSGVTTYLVSVPEGTTHVNISAEAMEPLLATVTGAGTGLALSGNKTTFNIVVTAENLTTKTYTVTVTITGERFIDTLKVNGSTLTLGGNKTYQATIPYGETEVVINAVISGSDKMTINGTAATSGTDRKITVIAGAPVTVKIVVSAANGDFATEYTVSISRAAASTDNSITHLYAGGTELTLSGDTYTGAEVAYTATFVNVKIEVPEFATMKVNSVDRSSGVEFSVPLTAGGDTQVTIVVTAQSGAAATYKLIIPRVPLGSLSGENRLESLSLSMTDGTPIVFDTAFSPDVTTYLVNVQEGTTHVNISAEAMEPLLATVTGAGTGLALSGNKTTFNIVVTAENLTTKTYTVTVTITGERFIDALKVNGSTLTLGGNKTYQATIPYGETEVVINAVISGGDIMTINGTAATSGTDRKITVIAGAPVTVKMVVSAANGDFATEYTVSISRAAASEDNSLKGVYVDGAAVTASGSVYTGAEVAYTVTSVSVRIELPEFATMKVNSVDRASGASFNLSLTDGADTEVTIIVTAQNNVSATYTLVIPRKEKDILPGDNDLSSLTLRYAAGGEMISFTEPFSAIVTRYSALVAPKTTSVYVEAAVGAASEAVIVGGTGAVSLSGSSTLISITVRAANGQERLYTIEVTIRPEVSEENRITSIKIDEISGFAFAEDKLSYTLFVPHSVDKLTFRVFTADPTARVREELYKSQFGLGAEENEKVNTFNLNGKGESKSFKIYAFSAENKGETYYFIIERLAEGREIGQDDVRLSELELVYTLTVGGAETSYDIRLLLLPGSYGYQVSLPVGVTEFVILAKAEYENFRVEGAGTYTLTQGSQDIRIRVYYSGGGSELRQAAFDAEKGELYTEYTITVNSGGTGGSGSAETDKGVHAAYRVLTFVFMVLMLGAAGAVVYVVIRLRRLKALSIGFKR